MADDLETITCGQCGIRFGVPGHWLSTRREKKDSFYCPNGHHRAFRESTSERLQRELDHAKQNAAYLHDQIRGAKDDAENERKRRIALSGQVTKMKNRASAGVCPCCNRTFKQLAAHMADKHPSFKTAPMADSNVVPLASARA